MQVLGSRGLLLTFSYQQCKEQRAEGRPQLLGLAAIKWMSAADCYLSLLSS